MEVKYCVGRLRSNIDKSLGQGELQKVSWCMQGLGNIFYNRFRSSP